MRSAVSKRPCAPCRSRADRGLGIWHLKPDQDKGENPSHAESCKRRGLAQVMRDGAAGGIAQRGAEPDGKPDYSHS
jgi:hypothetical protein